MEDAWLQYGTFDENGQTVYQLIILMERLSSLRHVDELLDRLSILITTRLMEPRILQLDDESCSTIGALGPNAGLQQGLTEICLQGKPPLRDHFYMPYSDFDT